MKKFYILLLLTSLISYHSLTNAADYWDGKDYFENSSSQKDAAFDLLKYVFFKGNEHILDVGCGDGKITADIALKVPQGTITGIDVSPSMIAFASKNFPQKKYPNLHFLLRDAQDIDYQDEFDTILSFTALQWIPNHDSFLKAANKSLKPSGLLAITMPIGLPKPLEIAVNEITSSSLWAPYFQEFSTGWNFISEDDYRDLLLTNQFHITRCQVVPQRDIFPTRASFETFLSQIFPYLRVLPKELKQTFLNQVVDRFLDLETPFPNDEVHWKFLRLEVIAKKN